MFGEIKNALFTRIAIVFPWTVFIYKILVKVLSAVM